MRVACVYCNKLGSWYYAIFPSICTFGNDIYNIYTCGKTVSRDISAAVSKLVAVCITVAVQWLSVTRIFSTAAGEASSYTGTFANEDTNINVLKMMKCSIFNFHCMTLCITFGRRAWRKHSTWDCYTK